MSLIVDCGAMKRFCSWQFWKRCRPNVATSDEQTIKEFIVTSDSSNVYASTDCSSNQIQNRSMGSDDESPDRILLLSEKAITNNSTRQQHDKLNEDFKEMYPMEQDLDSNTPTLCGCFIVKTVARHAYRPTSSVETPPREALTWKKTCRKKLNKNANDIMTKMVQKNTQPEDNSIEPFNLRKLRSRLGSFFSVRSKDSYLEEEAQNSELESVKGSGCKRSCNVRPPIVRFAETLGSNTNNAFDDDNNSDYFSIDDNANDSWDTVGLLTTVDTMTDENTDQSYDRHLQQKEPFNFIEAYSVSKCPCSYICHVQFDPAFPVVTPPGIAADSYEERLIVSQSLVGKWITILERSETLDPQYRQIGLGMVKRAVMNRLAIPLTMFLEENDTILHCWVHTPLGIRHMKSNLKGEECIDDDPDAGRWIGTSKVIDYSVSWYCNGTPVRALQQVRTNPKVGTSIETRCVLPDSTEGKIMLFSFVMIPKGKTERLSADRILKLSSTNQNQLTE